MIDRPKNKLRAYNFLGAVNPSVVYSLFAGISARESTFNFWFSLFSLKTKNYCLKSVCNFKVTRFYLILLWKQHNWTSGTYSFEISTWSYENRVSKHFVIFLNVPCLIACLLCCSLESFVFARFVVDYYLTLLPPPPIFFSSDPQFSWLFEISARLNLASVAFRSLHFVIGHLGKSFPESIM